jgi:hypothetical protein
MKTSKLVAVVSAAGLLTALAPVAAHAGGGGGGGIGGVGAKAQVPLVGTPLSPGSSGVFQYEQPTANQVKMLVQVQGAGAAASGPATLVLSTRNLDCSPNPDMVVPAGSFDAKGQLKFQPASGPVLAFVSKSRLRVTVTTAAGTVATSTGETCAPGHP